MTNAPRLAVYLLLTSLGALAQAAEPRVSLDIPAQPLERALNAFAQQTGLQLLFRADAVAGSVMGPRLVGTFTAQDALEKLLANTSLSYKFLDERTVAVRPQKPSDEAERDATTRQTSVEPLHLAQAGAEPTSDESNPEEIRENADPAAELEEIVVTGTHIRGTRNETTPLVVIDREQILRTGYATTQDLIRSLPQNFQGGTMGASEDGIFGSGTSAGINITGATGINLRGLGESSTLVLLNGHRMAPSATGTIVDISLIPLAAIERIEMLTDGSSAIYGADAVGGVVNIITRSDYQGAHSSARYGSAAHSARSDWSVAQTVGVSWEGGGVTGVAQYQEQGRLRASDREFASALTRPNDLLPDAESYGIALNARQQLSEKVALYGDSLFSRRQTARDYSFPDVGGIVGASRASSRGINLASGLSYELASGWSLDVGSQFSEQLSQRQRRQLVALSTEENATIDTRFHETAADLILNGTLPGLRAGTVGMALGASYRDESLDYNEILLSGAPNDFDTRRDVKAVYGEMQVPLVSEANALPAIRSLGFSAAVRWDEYSDFGSTSTPRLGVHWSPLRQIDVRAAYSRSFRAPNPLESVNSGNGFIFVLPFAEPGGAGVVPALVMVGTRPNIGPERARSFNAGIDFLPQGIPGLKLSADYYHIRYTDRLVTPPPDTSALAQMNIYGSLITSLSSDTEAQEFVDAAVTNGLQYFEDPAGVTGVRNAVDFRLQNAALVKQSGLDLRASYNRAFVAGVFSASSTIAWIDKIATAFAAGASAADIVDTIANPVSLRARLDAGWDSRRWALNGALNYTDRYVNTSEIGHPDIGSWTTVDLVGRLKLDGFADAGAFQGASMTLSVQNLLDKDPPFVSAPSLLISVNYDPANANPLRRVIALEFAKEW